MGEASVTLITICYFHFIHNCVSDAWYNYPSFTHWGTSAHEELNQSSYTASCPTDTLVLLSLSLPILHWYLTKFIGFTICLPISVHWYWIWFMFLTLFNQLACVVSVLHQMADINFIYAFNFSHLTTMFVYYIGWLDSFFIIIVS